MSVSSRETPSSACPLALSAVESAEFVNVSRSTWWKLHAQGKVPLPIRLGRCTRWRRAEIEAWIAAGCPDRVEWERIRETTS